ncbi:SIR2 family protein, partial [Staphylococcus epidermidis]|uniref:SIR2 family protein n=1 Tax=Staphylococcus epidermidis TaxID=1282 RepID=UPI001EF99B87
MIKEYLEKSESLPYLFIGSGFSKRYLNLPNWENLLEEVADLVYDNKFKLAQKKNLAKKEFNPNTHYNQYMTYLCDLISNDLDLIWYDDDKFKESRDKYSDSVITSGVLPIKIEIAKIIKKNNKVLEKMKPELEIFKQLTTHSIGGIITTNYDSLIEDIFDFEVYRTQQQLLFQKNHEIGEIYKIHGCVTEPETIMITSEDYQMIEEKNKYLAAKLLTIFIEHPIVFIGYSINAV